MGMPEKIRSIVIELKELRVNMPDAELNINWSGNTVTFKLYAEQYRKHFTNADQCIAFLEGLNADPVAAKQELRGEYIEKIDLQIAALILKKKELEA